MQEKKSDRRTNRTRRMLKESLLSLILEKGYAAVTVEDITERADLGRTTFYLHYKDKEDLLLESIETTANELVEYISQYNLLPAATESGPLPSERYLPAIQLVFRHAGDNAMLYRIILREGAVMASERLRSIINAAAGQIMNARFKENPPDVLPPIPMEVLSNYFASSLLGLVTWWLESNMPYPPEEMADIFRRLFFDGIQGATRIKN
jgi:AcrR family transcriptional regulator